MARIVVSEYISVDGVVEAPSGTETFERVGWTDAYNRGPEGDQFKIECLGPATGDRYLATALLDDRLKRRAIAVAW